MQNKITKRRKKKASKVGKKSFEVNPPKSISHPTLGNSRYSSDSQYQGKKGMRQCETDNDMEVRNRR